MSKRRASTDAGQLCLMFAPQVAASGPAAFAGTEAWVAAEVGRMLKADPRSREEVAGAVSSALADDVSRWMLDAYSSPARDTHNISFARTLALMAVTSDRAMAERAISLLGGSILWGEEINAARLGNLRAQERAIRTEIRKIEGALSPIKRERAK